MDANVRLKIKEDFIQEIIERTKEKRKNIEDYYSILIMNGSIKDYIYNDMYISIYNDICEKYQPMGIHN
tara:strand:+ start:9899 stop:10105 length:207 start_codon:yes stop_codon:yes gene_type:complete